MNFLAKQTLVTEALGTISLVAIGMLAGRAPASNEDPRVGNITLLQGGDVFSDGAIAGWVEKRVDEWQIRAGERRFDEIGWAKDIRDALRLAKQHSRPMFLFTHDGRMATGRC